MSMGYEIILCSNVQRTRRRFSRARLCISAGDMHLLNNKRERTEYTEYDALIQVVVVYALHIL